MVQTTQKILSVIASVIFLTCKEVLHCRKVSSVFRYHAANESKYANHLFFWFYPMTQNYCLIVVKMNYQNETFDEQVLGILNQILFRLLVTSHLIWIILPDK